jgi:hypothetical protein
MAWRARAGTAARQPRLHEGRDNGSGLGHLFFSFSAPPLLRSELLTPRHLGSPAARRHAVFYYTVGQADVVQADEVGYNKCNATNAIYNYSKGRSFTFQLNETKTYYVCSYGYCGGMRLAIKAESCRRRPRQPPLRRHRRLREVPRGRHLRRRRRAGRTPQDGLALAGKNLPAGPFVWFELGLLLFVLLLLSLSCIDGIWKDKKDGGLV